MVGIETCSFATVLALRSIRQRIVVTGGDSQPWDRQVCSGLFIFLLVFQFSFILRRIFCSPRVIRRAFYFLSSFPARNSISCVQVHLSRASSFV